MTTEHHGAVVVLSPDVDHLDSSNYTAVREEVEAATADRTRVVLDMGRVRFVDSAGLGAILSIMRRLGERGGTLKIAAVTPSVEQLFDLVRLKRIIDIYPTSEDAVGAFQS